MATDNYKFIKMGNKLGTDYAPTGNGAYQLIDDFYSMVSGPGSAMMKSAGAATYGDNGYFNAIMGKEITAGIFSSDNTFAALGTRAYNHEGVRIQTEQPSYGLADGTVYNDDYNRSNGEFLGIGAITTQDGVLPQSNAIPIYEFREPYKEVPFTFEYGLGLIALQNHDDVSAYNDYVEKCSAGYSNLIDLSILRPITSRQPVKNGIETSLNSIYRVIASGSEANATSYSSEGDITPAMVTPYGGTGSDFYSFRNAGNTSSSISHTENMIDGNVFDLGGGVLSIGDMRKLWRTCQVNWDGDYNNKAFFMSPVAQDKLGALMMANNVYLDSVYVQRDFNGVKTLPGRDAGMLLSGFNNTPIIMDGNIGFDFGTKRVSSTKFGDIALLDLNHIWVSMFTPVELVSNNNIALLMKLQERNVMHMRCEVRSDKYICHGRIKGVADDN